MTPRINRQIDRYTNIKSNLFHKVLYSILRYTSSCCLWHSSFHHRGLYIQIFELLLKLVHQGRDLLQVHGLHSSRHALNNSLNKIQPNHRLHSSRHALNNSLNKIQPNHRLHSSRHALNNCLNKIQPNHRLHSSRHALNNSLEISIPITFDSIIKSIRLC